MSRDIDLRLGRWQDALSDVEAVDCLITDTPYSGRTHKGHNASAGAGDHGHGGSGTPISYSSWTREHVEELVAGLHERVRGWWVTITDHELGPAWARAFEKIAGLYVFAPLPIVIPGSRVRLSGDGPSCWTYWAVVARPKSLPYSRWGTLPGAYVAPTGLPRREKEVVVPGGKPLWLMQALVRDYSRPGDVILDPCAGGGTTLLAAAQMGRRAIGAEMDPETFDLASRRISQGYTPVLPGMEGRREF